MAKRRRRGAKATPGSSPGLLTAPPDAHLTEVRIMAYDAAELIEVEFKDIEQLEGLLAKYEVTWVDVTGLADVRLIERIGAALGLHSLALEDVVNIPQRPKVEAYGETLFGIMHMFSTPDPGDAQQVSFFIGERGLLTFEEHPGDCFDPVRKRLREGRERIRSSGPDYLAYALVDAIVDGYFPLVEAVGEWLEKLETQILDDPGERTLALIYEAKRALIDLRRHAWPQRDAVAALAREDAKVIKPSTHIFLRDCHDHAVRVMDLLESHREVVSGLVDLHMSVLSQRMNEVMKVLTIIATIFIPLSFIAGIYGMNFDPEASPLNMPELHWFFGYPMALALMVGVAMGLLYWFRRKDWL